MAMHTPLALASLLMGVAGGPHCIAMCGAACAGIHSGGSGSTFKFHLGRITGYSALGAIAAYSVNSLAWVSSQSLALHPLWTFFHVLILSWGVVLMAYARQPIWADNFGRTAWSYIRQLTGLPGGTFMTGILWTFLPCGLLYSALLLAALSANAIYGAFSMACFALGTSLSLVLGPVLWLQLKRGRLLKRGLLKRGIASLNEDRSMRLSGLLLTLVAAWAIWMDLAHPFSIWCS